MWAWAAGGGGRYFVMRLAYGVYRWRRPLFRNASCVWRISLEEADRSAFYVDKMAVNHWLCGGKLI